MLSQPPIPGLWYPFAHYDCIHNHVVSIHNRVAGVVPTPNIVGLTRMDEAGKLIARNLPKTSDEPLGQFALKYSGRKRAVYERGVERLLAEGIYPDIATVSMFVKCEKTNPTLKINPDPRAVQFRSPTYCVAVASFLKPIEEHLYRLTIQHPQISETRLVGKGLNQVERATLLKKKLEYFRTPAILSLDMSRFDQHVDIEQLKLEHKIYLRCNNDPLFRKLLKWQLINKVRSSTGVRYTVKGKRMSGDMNTALGNCLIMLMMTIGAMLTLPYQFDVLDDGDDCILIVEKSVAGHVKEALPQLFLDCGHELKIENEAFSVPEISWCQSNPIHTKLGWKFVRDPIKVMSCCLVGTRWINCPTWLRLQYIAGLGQCELMLNVGVPVLQEYAFALLRNANGADPRYDKGSGEWFRCLREFRLYRKLDSDHYDTEISDAARLTFSIAFGIDVESQIMMETALRSWTFPVDGDVPAFGDIDPATWVDGRDFVPCLS